MRLLAVLLTLIGWLPPDSLIRVALAAPPGVIHATPEEIAIWRQRSQHDAFQTEWNRLLASAKAFRDHPDAALWPGNQTSHQWNAHQIRKKQQRPNYHPGRKRGGQLRDAGFVYLITGETSFRDRVRDTLLKQVTIPGTDFGNPAKWSRKDDCTGHHDFEIANWIRKLAYGYSYIRASLSEADQAVIDAWFKTAATYLDRAVHNNAKHRFPNRYRDEYDTPNPRSKYNPGNRRGTTHWGGPTVYSFHRAWLNIPATYNAAVAAVGVLLDDATLKDHAARFVKEWLMFNVAPDGTVADQFRWNTKTENPPLWAYHYAGTVIGSIVATVDHLARAGDVSLYEYETSFGHFGWDGGPKSLKRVLRRFADLTLSRQASDAQAKAYASTDAQLQLSEMINPGNSHIHAIYLAPANVYYKDPSLKKAYLRELPRKPFSPGCSPWSGDWCTYPSVLFMFGNMDNRVWPYPTADR
jgi:hypothetical protein